MTMSDIFPLFALKVVTYPSSMALFVKGCSPLVTLSSGPRFPRALRKNTWDNRLRLPGGRGSCDQWKANCRVRIIWVWMLRIPGFEYSRHKKHQKALYEYADAHALNVWCIYLRLPYSLSSFEFSGILELFAPTWTGLNFWDQSR